MLRNFKICLLTCLLLYPINTSAAVIVENLAKGSGLQEAGLQPGDVLVEWKLTTGQASQQVKPGDTGQIDSFFHWMYLVIEVAPRGIVQLTAYRSEEVIQFSVLPGAWVAEIRPRTSENLEQELKRAELLADDGKTQEAFAIISEVTASEPALCAWILLRIGSRLTDDNDSQVVQEVLATALNHSSSTFSRAIIWDTLGSTFESMKLSTRAEQAYKSAISESRQVGEESLSYARSLYQLGRFLADRGKLKEAEEFLETAVRIQRQQAPRSKATVDTLAKLGACAREMSQLDRAETIYKEAIEILRISTAEGMGISKLLSNLAGVEKDRGDLEKAKQLLSEALKIAETESSQDIVYAGILGNLSNIAFNQGDLAEARQYLGRAQRLVETIAPNSLMLAAILEGNAVIAQSSGDLVASEDLNLKALHLRQRLAPNSLAVANSLNLRGVIAKSRGRNDIARTSYLEALKIQEQIDPDGLELATTLNNLGSLHLDSNELDTAETYYKRALAIQKRLAPDSLPAARSLANLGAVERHKGRKKQAEELYRAALNLQETAAPGGLESAATLRRLGDLAAMEGGDHQKAKRLYEEALTILQRLAPGSKEEARVLLLLAKLSSRNGRYEIADIQFTKAINAIESQINRLGGSSSDRAEFRADQGELYGRAIEFYIDQNQADKAFYLLESYRARSILELMSSRDLIFGDVPADLSMTRRRIAARYEAVQAALARLNPHTEIKRLQTLQKELQRLRTEYDEISEKILRSFPKLAAIHHPQPLGAKEISTSLDPGTVILSYLINPARSFLFILDASGRLRVTELSPGGHYALRDKVERFREAIRESAARNHIGAMHTLLSILSSELYKLLVSPAGAEIQAGQRVLIIPEGPLHFLPWGALLANDLGQTRYFGEWKSLHLIQSATLYTQTQRMRSTYAPFNRLEGRKLTAFGDPSLPPSLVSTKPEGIEDVSIRSAVERGLKFERLPAAQLEVNKISSFFRSPSLFVGREASEENAKSLPRDTHVVHFATHTQLDEQFPLDSALVLSIPEHFTEGSENGLLQAWEIFERVRVDADLVVLSACESGLGKELGGEGLIGLTRAFQYAGARTVLASLWKISDRTTAELMVRFYKHLRAGKTKDDALRAAQIELIRGPIEITNEKGEVERIDASAPYYWAAFQLYGDWQ